MQENVKVFTPEVLVGIFGNVKATGNFSYKLKVDCINSRQLRELAKVNDDYGMNFHIRRSDKGLLIFESFINQETGLPNRNIQADGEANNLTTGQTLSYEQMGAIIGRRLD